jgi:DNA-binding beta-propeller fold protein YncE
MLRSISLSLTVGSLLALAFSTASTATDTPVLVPGAVIELPASTGKFDFLRIDTKRGRLLAAHESDGTSDFFDLRQHKLITRVKVGGAVDTAIDPATGRYYVSVQEAERVAVIDGTTLKEVKSIKLEGPSDAIIYEPKNKRIYVTHDDGTHVWVIDPASDKIVAAVDIPAGPEYMVYDAAANRIYLNIKTTHEVVAIDPDTNKVVAHWPTAPATNPHGLAFDPASRRIFSSGANGVIVAMDTVNGKVKTTAPITLKVDQIEFDPFSHRIYCAGPDVMSVVLAEGGELKALGEVKTAATAKNVAVDPATHSVWTTYTDGKSSFARSWSLPK